MEKALAIRHKAGQKWTDCFVGQCVEMKKLLVEGCPMNSDKAIDHDSKCTAIQLRVLTIL